MKLIAFLAAAGALLATPNIRELSPRGAQRGKTFLLRVKGDGLLPGARVESALPASFSYQVPARKLNEGMARPNTELSYLVELKADAPSGIYPLRLVTADGISNVMLFPVGDAPEVAEMEAEDGDKQNGAPEQAEPLAALPVVVNGTLRGADIDMYSFAAKAGQKLVIELEARRAGSAIDPAFEVLDATGQLFAKNDDAAGIGVDSRLEVLFPKAGNYLIRVHDSKYSAQDQNFYRLKLGNHSFAEGIYPLGWKRGEDVEISFVGGNLAQPVKLRARPESRTELAEVRLPSGSTAFGFVLSGNANELEPPSLPAPLKPGTVMNGRVSKPGEVDKYTLAVKPGEQWIFEVEASSTGASQLDALITVFDQTGKKLASRDDIAAGDPALPLTIPEGVTNVTLALEDVLRRGGANYAYRLEARRSPPDFTAKLLTPFVNVPAGGTALVNVLIQRRGYDGAIQLHIPNLPKGVTMAGGHVPPEAAAQLFTTDNAGFRAANTTITLTAAPDAKMDAVNLEVVAQAEGVSMTRRAAGPALVTAVRGLRQAPVSMYSLGYDLPMAVSKPLPYTLSASVPMIRISQGFEYPIAHRMKRAAGAKAAGKVREVTAGAVGNLRVLQGPPSTNPVAGTLLLNTNFATPITRFDIYLAADAEVDGRQVTVVSPMIEVDVVPGYRLEPERTEFRTKPGGAFTVSGRLRREPTFEGGAVQVKLDDLPAHVVCAAALVAPDQNTFSFQCEAGAAAQAGQYDVRITSAAPEVGRNIKAEYKVADTAAKLTLGGASE